MVDPKIYKDFKIWLISNNLTMSAWLRVKMQEELDTGTRN